MPLAVGNTWTYEDRLSFEGSGGNDLLDTITYTVTAQVSKAGKQYFEYMPTRDTIWLSDGTWAFYHLDTFYFRAEEPGKVYDLEEAGERLFYDFNTPYAATQTFLPYTFERDTTNVKVTAGSFANCVIVRGGYLNRVREIYAEGVGLIHQDLEGPTRTLLSAKVGGRSYP
jgi:hypothetical protein